MKALSLKDVWRWGIALTLVATLAGGLYGSQMFHEAPSEPIREAAPSEPIREAAPSEPIREAPFERYKDTVVRRVGEHAYEVTFRDRVDVLRSRCTLSQPDVRLVFAYPPGKVPGIQISGIRPGSVYDKLGLEDGDILQFVNGHVLEPLEGFMYTCHLWSSYGHRFEVVLLRDGRTLRKVYELK
ncbi:hypothetical protein NVS55_37715 [Myxococcus stipitatus]|uniref:hypothetical protein n=1 Tax=Myxococcus stipitatus TaxID=83455 RepID=UPI0031451E94